MTRRRQSVIRDPSSGGNGENLRQIFGSPKGAQRCVGGILTWLRIGGMSSWYNISTSSSHEYSYTFGLDSMMRYLPNEQPPELVIVPQMRQNMYMEKILGICDGDQ